MGSVSFVASDCVCHGPIASSDCKAGRSIVSSKGCCGCSPVRIFPLARRDSKVLASPCTV
ncbi:hypothetical protein B0H67DRAFT_580577 [Lasiosphaeris hirsuta]|uniref:Uncharacterized protein n=1 Tax=Lasiosphaeris hirsuta TaxID=260670 RepID=A0AA40DW89_9PEZI|nr:hypothetical protein B0H67DRAFT_580577 [Lasiosphaeris hirsuta]